MSSQTPAAKNEVSPSGTLDAAIVEMLLESEMVSAEILQTLQERSHGDEAAFEHLLTSEGFLSEDQLTWIKAQAHGQDFVDLRQVSLTKDMLALLPKSFAQAQKTVPVVNEKTKELAIAMADPGNGVARRLLQKKFGTHVPIRMAMDAALSEVLHRYDLAFEERCAQLIKQYQEAQQTGRLDDDAVLEFLNALLLHGVRERASDLHLEPRASECAVRERIDGILRMLVAYPKEVHPLIAIRIKILANLATDEHTAPQDGKFSFDGHDGKRVDVRVSIVTTTHGEKIVLRLLVAQDWSLSMEQLGLMSADQQIMEKEMQRTWGMILVTGPTGSGKTTSLYALLRRLNSDDVNISTIEDPVEYDLPGTNQIQVNEKVGLTFATGLRSIVRQDPDDILVGEIRDAETASIAVNSAMTGHLVLSTLHTNDAATAILRLKNMGAEPFLISSTVNVIVAQRLVRKICFRCRASFEMTPGEVEHSLPPNIAEKFSHRHGTARLYRGRGCDICAGSGYQGRTGIFEVMIMNDAIRSLLMQDADADAIQKAAVAAGMTTMLDDGIEKVLQGITTVEEVLRVIRS